VKQKDNLLTLVLCYYTVINRHLGL